MSTTPSNFDREIDAAIRAAQRAAGFDFLGALTRLCLLPALGSVNETDNVPAYVRDPSAAPAREAWYADAAQVFDNLYFRRWQDPLGVGTEDQRRASF